MSQIAASIIGLTFHYEGPLTLKQINEYLNTVKMQYINPVYLFLTDNGEGDLAAEATQIYNMECEPGEHKEISTLVSLLGMHVVILPTLPKNTLTIGEFILFSPTPLPAPGTNKRTLNLPTMITGFLEVPSPIPYEDTMKGQMAMITRHINEQPRLTRDQIESVSEQAIQHMKDKQINLDWDEE
jgi:hypothetical protein